VKTPAADRTAWVIKGIAKGLFEIMDSAQNAAVHQLIEDAEIARLMVGELAFSQ
jgi:hypothetical protein